VTTVRRAIVEVRWAKVPVRKAVIEPGGTLRVGRSDRADLVVPNDRSMSGVHCELQWDGTTCRIKDRSLDGTLLNGEPVTEGEVKNGGWIRAGGTVLSVYIEKTTPPRAASGLKGDGTDRLNPSQAAAIATLAQAPGHLYAVLNAARTLRVIEVLRESVEPCRSLYEGIKGDALAMQAPYLVALPLGSRLFEQLVLEGWGKRWGIYLTSPRPFDEVRTQLRRSLMVHNIQSGERMYFRFYDPKMLRLVLSTCGLRQREQIFGEITAFLVEGKDGEVVRLTAHEVPAELTARIEPPTAKLDE